MGMLVFSGALRARHSGRVVGSAFRFAGRQWAHLQPGRIQRGCVRDWGFYPHCSCERSRYRALGRHELDGYSAGSYSFTA
jgi:hypothetical protein